MPIDTTTIGERVPAFAPLGSLLEGRYRIEEKVGEGGTSFVYLATDMATTRPCAIKHLSPPLAQQSNATARLKREAEFGMRLAHPNVCRIDAVGETHDGLVYVVMPFVDGEVLSDRINRLGHIPLDEAVALVQTIAAGLQAAHDLDIIHSDLKPENVMISRRRNGAEYAVVMDLGLANERLGRREAGDAPGAGVVVGTPAFMSPEQLRGEPLDARTDIYALTLTTYEMLTGRLPFDGRTEQEMMIARLSGDPMPLRTARPDLGFAERVERVIEKGMARDPDARPRTALEFANALAAAVAGGDGPMAGRVDGSFAA